MFSKRVTLIATLVLLIPSLAWAMRSKKPQTFTNLQDTNQLTELNTTLADLWNITNGRYTLENITTNPQDTRKGVKGDLVYATFGSNDHLCINTSFPAGFDWTCVNVGTLSDCPGGADTMVQFNDNGDCGGDLGFLYDKNSDQASLGPDATIAYTLSPTLVFGGGDTNRILYLRRTEIKMTSQDYAGIVNELNITPSILNDYELNTLSGFVNRRIINGTVVSGDNIGGNEVLHFGAQDIVTITGT